MYTKDGDGEGKEMGGTKSNVQLAARRAGDAITRTMTSMIIAIPLVNWTMQTLADQVWPLRMTILDAVLSIYQTSVTPQARRYCCALTS